MLPVTFHYNQGNLQDFVDCPRRFQLRYVQAQAWPAVQVEPLLEHERHIERGAEFHRLIERHQLGIDPAVLAANIHDPDLLAWWRAYLEFDFLHSLWGQRYAEYALSTRLGGVTLTATFDLLLVVPGERVIIFDWKTYSHVPERRWLESRLQTRVYPYVAVSAGAGLLGQPVKPEQVSMVYWVSGTPASPTFFEYDVAQYERDRGYLGALIGEVSSLYSEPIWPLTADVARCRFCGYRSLCGRGVGAEESSFDEFSFSDSNIAREGLMFGLEDVEESGF